MPNLWRPKFLTFLGKEAWHKKELLLTKTSCWSENRVFVFIAESHAHSSLSSAVLLQQNTLPQNMNTSLECWELFPMAPKSSQQSLVWVKQWVLFHGKINPLGPIISTISHKNQFAKPSACPRELPEPATEPGGLNQDRGPGLQMRAKLPKQRLFDRFYL